MVFQISFLKMNSSVNGFQTTTFLGDGCISYLTKKKKKSKCTKCMNIKRQRIKEQWVRFL